MISKIKKPVSILLSLIMIFSLFTIVPITASAADTTVTFVKLNAASDVNNMVACSDDQALAWINPRLNDLKAERQAAGAASWLWLLYGKNGAYYNAYCIDDSGKLAKVEDTSVKTFTYNDINQFMGYGDTFYYASVTAPVETYTITWKNEDGTVLDTYTGVEAGTTPSYGGETPTKASTAEYTYTFAGWTPEVTAVTGDAEYTATFTPAARTYTVTWKNGEDVLGTDAVAYGETPSYDGETPAKDADAENTYTFAGWTPEVTAVTGDAEYTATFTPAARSYTVTWKNGEDVLGKDTVAYGETPSYDGETPTKDTDAQYTYTFAGWTPEVAAVTGDVTYTAAFTPVTRSYTVTWKNGEDVLGKDTVAYGETPAYTGETPTKASTEDYIYIFAGWTPEVAAVTGDATYTATFDAVASNSVAAVNGTGYETLTDAISAAEAGQTVTLLADIETTSSISISKNLTLDLNGYGIKANYTSEYSSLLSLANRETEVEEVILKDSRPDNTSNTSGNRPDGVTGGYITGCKAEAVYVLFCRKFIMEGGTIINNRGGVATNSGRTFIMNGGTITNNHATGTTLYGNGGGVRNSGYFTMNGGVISNNTAVSKGGGIYSSGYGCTINGGTITGNSADGLGGGVYISGTSLNLSGDPVIKDNKVDDASSNVYLEKNGNNQRQINISAALSNTEPIGVSMAEPGVFTKNLKNRGNASNFTSDDSTYSVVLDNSGNAKLTVHVHEFSYALATVNSENDSITATCNTPGCNLTGPVTLTLTPTTTLAPETPPSGTIIIVNPANYQATLTGLDAFNEATALGLKQSDVKYYNTENGAKTGDALSSTPYHAGTYCAEITVDGKTASIIYTIEAPKYPGMPTQVLARVTDTTITAYSPAQSGEKYEYQIALYDGTWTGEWTKNTTFTGLNTHTKYYVRARMTEHPDDTVVETTRTTYYTTTIEGTAKVGQKLTANVTDLTPESDYNFLWYVQTSDTPTYGKTYTIQAGDVGKQARLVVTTKSGTVVGKAYSDPIVAENVLTAADFTYTAPADLVYNGEEKAATVTCTKQDAGEITVEYWIGNEVYSTTPPTEVGTYTVKISIPETANYSKVEHLTAEGWTFTITQAPFNSTVEIEGWTYGEDANAPSVPGYSGNVTYTYAAKGSEEFSETVPSNAGEYTVKATAGATRNYQGGEATADFTIEKATPVVTLDTKTLYYNGKWQELVQSAALTIGDGIDISDEAKLWYSLEGGLNELDYPPVGKNIGKYQVYTRVEALTDNVNAIAYGEEPYCIVEIVAVPTVKMTGYTYGDKEAFPTPEVEGNVGDGEVTYKYYPADGDAADAKVWDDSITELTLDAGDYKMFAEIAESETTVAVTTEAVDFTVGVKTVAEPTIIYTPEENTYNGEEIKPAVTVKDGDVVIDASEYTVTYKENIKAGTATITVTDNEGGNYTVSGTQTFVIKKAELELTLTIEGWTFGEEANAPELTGNAGEGKVTYLYKLTDADDETYTETVPSNAGNYTVKAVVAETDNYLSGEKTADFTIAKAAINPEVTIEDWTYGEEANKPVVTGNTGNGKVVYTYATSDDYVAFLRSEKTGDEAFAITEAPTQAGYYVLRAEIAETDNYLGGFAYDTFRIAKADIAPEVTIEGWIYGEDANEPVVTGNDGNGEVTYTYAVKGSDEFTAEVPENAGEYTVKAVIAASANYNGGECTADFTISKAAVTPEVTIEGWTYGEDANEPVVTGNDGNGEVTITYAIKGSDEFTAEVPENAGEYTVKAVIAKTDNYDAAEATADFTIAKADITPNVTIEGWTYGEDANEPEVTGNTGEGEVTITYAVKGSDEFTADVPENAGEYTVKAVIAETANYNGAEATADFTIVKADITPAVTIEGWAYGEEANTPEVTGNTGEGEVTFTYAVKGSDEFTADVPKNAGEYTVKAVIAETDNYNGAEATADFTITKADPKMTEDGDFNVVALNLVFNNEKQNLVTEYVKEGSGLVVRYSFYPEGMNPQIAGNIPRAKDIGEYPIYYMVEGNDNYNDVPWTVVPLTATIEKDTFEVSINGWTYGAYDAEANAPVATANFTDYEKFTYTYAVKGSDEFTADVPVNVGEYTVKASIDSANAYYSTLTATADFSIVKADLTPTVTIEGWTYGEDANEPEVTGNDGNGEVTITYAVKGSDAFTADVPKNAGEYTVKAVIAETDNYNSAEVTADFTIAKADFTPDVTIEGWIYGEEANDPEVTGNTSSGEVTFTYAAKDSGAFTADVPTDAGEYTVKAVIAETDNYNSAEATADFTIAKADITPVVTVEGWAYGKYDEAVNGPSVSGNPGNGDVTYQYKVKDAADDTYTDERPENTGDYTVKAIVSETANYNGAEAVADFTIVKAAIEPEIILNDWSYSEEPNSPAINEGGNPGNGAVEYTYAFRGSDAYSRIKPELPGNYTVKAVIAETDNYLGTTVYKDFIIRKGTFEPTVTLESWLYGAEPNEPELTGNISEGAVKFTYAPEGSDAFSATVPTTPGSYVVKASIASTDLYDAVEVTGTFEIKKSHFTITWKNDDGTVLKTDTDVPAGTTPSYDGETPKKDADAQYTYTFAGWTDGENTYALNEALPEVTEDITYTAVFTSTERVVARLVGYTISLDGDIGLNFYMELSPEIAQSETAYMHFTISDGANSTVLDIPVSQAKVKGKYYVFKCNVAAKEIDSKISGQIIDGELSSAEYTYSVKGYADYLLAHTSDNPEYAKAAPLVEKMLQYGAYAKEYFDNTDTLDNLDDVTIDIADPVVDGLPESTTFAGATLSLKSETTLSLFFKSSETLTFSCNGYTVETDTSGDYQIARIRGIKAKHIGDIISLDVNGATVKYSPLNYCKEVLTDETQNVKLQNVLKALYAYWQAADNYFN